MQKESKQRRGSLSGRSRPTPGAEAGPLLAQTAPLLSTWQALTSSRAESVPRQGAQPVSGQRP